jgi:hypothetical protein
MLSDRHYQLLTAYVDGELPAHQREAVERLVEQSPEARSILEKLQSDSTSLRRLPIRQAPETLAEVVMETLSDDTSRPLAQPAQPARALPAPSAIPVWLALPAAACVLLLVSLGTFLFFAVLLGDKPEQPQADNRIAPPPKVADNPPPKDEVKPVVRELDPLLGDLCAGAAEKFGEVVDAKETYVSLAVGQLDDAPARERLSKALKKDPGVHLDLPVASNAKAVDRLKEAFKKTGITMLVDTMAQGKLANNKKPTKGLSFVVYAENLKPEELTQVLRLVGKAELAARRRGRTIDFVAVKGMTSNDRNDLAQLLHVKIETLEPGKGSLWTPLIPVDPKDPKIPMGKPPERFALVLAKGQGLDGKNQSKEIAQFLAARQELDPRMLQVVLTVHEAGI